MARVKIVTTAKINPSWAMRAVAATPTVRMNDSPANVGVGSDAISGTRCGTRDEGLGWV